MLGAKKDLLPILDRNFLRKFLLINLYGTFASIKIFPDKRNKIIRKINLLKNTLNTLSFLIFLTPRIRS